MSVKGSQCWGPPGLVTVDLKHFSSFTLKEQARSEHMMAESTGFSLRLTWVAVGCVTMLALLTFPTSPFPTLGKGSLIVDIKGISES